MAEFDNTNRGAMFKNKRKEVGDKKPEYTGSLNVGGVDYFLDAWLKTAASGEKFMSVSIKQKDKQAAQPEPVRQAASRQPFGGFEDMDDDIPFNDPMKSRAFCLSC
jgi:hypothetical protein